MCRARLIVGIVVLLESARQPVRADELDVLRPVIRAELSERELAGFAGLPRYELDLQLADDLTSYTLTETITLLNTGKTALPKVVLRLYGNAGGASPAIVVDSVTCAPRVCKHAQPRPSVLELPLKAALAPGEQITITLGLRGQLRAITSGQTDMLSQGLASLTSLLTGEQTSDYGLLSVGEGIASLAHFYAVLAQQKGSGWVTEERKPFGDLGASGLSFVHGKVRAPRGVKIVSSGDTTPLTAADELRTSVYGFNAGLTRDFALVASRVLEERSRRVGDVNVRAFFLPADADGGARVLDTAASALAVFERHFGGYPFRELDVVEAPLVGGAGGCEFSGLVTVASMLYRPLALDLGQLGLGAGATGSPLEFTTAHEVAHQYWYGLVGSDARAHPFQDESLTQWSARLYFEERFGAERGAREAEAQIAMNYRVMRMLGQADAPVDRPVDAFDSPIAYAGLVYGKGAYLYPALRSLLGEQVFFSALRSYARQSRFRTAAPDVLFEQLGAASGRASEVRALVQHWLVQRHGDHDLGQSSELAGLAPKLGAARGATGAPGSLDMEQLKGLLGDPSVLDNANLPELMGRVQKLLGAAQGGDLDLGAVEKLLEQLQPAPGGSPQTLPPELQELFPSEPGPRGL